MKWDAIVVGGGHNGLVAAAYLAKKGLRALVLERRPMVGGAAVTEELIPNHHFSRASYLYSLFRPQIVEELDLKRHGLTLYPREPSSFTPTREGQALLLSATDAAFNAAQISAFSKKDSVAYHQYEEMLSKITQHLLVPLLDQDPIDCKHFHSISQLLQSDRVEWRKWMDIVKGVGQLRHHLNDTIQVLTAPASQVLNEWFESDVLKATLATDAIIGAMVSPNCQGSGYVLLHHVMGESEGIPGMWSYVRGGMGGVSNAIAKAALEAGVTVQTDAEVAEILVEGQQVKGVQLQSGEKLESDIILSNATPYHTLLELVGREHLSSQVVSSLENYDYQSPVAKINIALKGLPQFPSLQGTGYEESALQSTIHLADRMGDLEAAYLDAQNGIPSKRPIIELTIPSVLDDSLCPPGRHVASLFVQYMPYDIEGGWSEDAKQRLFDSCMRVCDEHAPGFSSLVDFADILPPPELERVFRLKGGNIFHGAINLSQLYTRRPLPGYANHSSPVKGLYICGAGAHPGGGVMGAPGRNCALKVMRELHI